MSIKTIHADAYSDIAYVIEGIANSTPVYDTNPQFVDITGGGAYIVAINNDDAETLNVNCGSFAVVPYGTAAVDQRHAWEILVADDLAEARERADDFMVED